MSLIISSLQKLPEEPCVPVSEQQKMNRLAQAFSKAAETIMDRAEEQFKGLVNDIDTLQSRNFDFEVVQESGQAVDSSCLKQSPEKVQPSNMEGHPLQNLIEPEKYSGKKLKISELNKMKQELMNKLKFVDNQLLNLKHEDTTHSKRVPLVEKQNNNDLVARSKISKTNKKVLKPLDKKQLQNDDKILENHSRTLQILNDFNNQKIRRHQEVINRMKKRQEDELNKIKELEQRKMEIQLKKSRFLNEKKTVRKNDVENTSRPQQQTALTTLKNKRKF